MIRVYVSIPRFSTCGAASDSNLVVNGHVPSVESEHVRLGRFLAGRDDEPKVAAMPPDGGRAELVPGAGSGCGGLLRLRSYGDECD